MIGPTKLCEMELGHGFERNQYAAQHGLSLHIHKRLKHCGSRVVL